MIWNTIPSDVREAESLTAFKSLCKMVQAVVLYWFLNCFKHIYSLTKSLTYGPCGRYIVNLTCISNKVYYYLLLLSVMGSKSSSFHPKYTLISLVLSVLSCFLFDFI